MRGLLAKDYALMKQRWKMVVLLIAWGILMTAVMDDSAFVVGWIVMIATILSVSTISYDEYDNTMPFLMSLPVTRKSYAVEKYLFSLICGTAFWVISLVIVTVSSLLRKKTFPSAEDMMGLILFLAVMLAVLALCIPPQLKWGAEKGRIVMIVVFGIVCAALFVAVKLGLFQNGPVNPETFSMPGIVIGCVAASLILIVVSIMISIRIMEKKEF